MQNRVERVKLRGNSLIGSRRGLGQVASFTGLGSKKAQTNQHGMQCGNEWRARLPGGGAGVSVKR
jgi:hypothetical protein